MTDFAFSLAALHIDRKRMKERKRSNWLDDKQKSENEVEMKLRFSPDSFFTLSFAHFRLLVAFGHDFIQRGTDHRLLVLVSTTSTLLDRHILGTLLVLDAVQEGPASRTWILLALQVRELGLAVDERKHFAVRLDVIFAMARVDFESGENAGFGPDRLMK